MAMRCDYCLFLSSVCSISRGSLYFRHMVHRAQYHICHQSIHNILFFTYLPDLDFFCSCSCISVILSAFCIVGVSFKIMYRFLTRFTRFTILYKRLVISRLIISNLSYYFIFFTITVMRTRSVSTMFCTQVCHNCTDFVLLFTCTRKVKFLYIFIYVDNDLVTEIL